MPEVGPEGATHAPDVDAAVLVEAAVLDGHDRLLDPRGDLIARDEHAALAAAEDGEDRVAVGGVDVAVHLLALRLLERIEPAQLCADGHDGAVRERRPCQNEEDGEKGEEAELPDPASAPRLGAVFAQ